jgi:peroxiredoxin
MLHPSKPVPALEIDTLDHGRFDLARDHGVNGTLLIFYRGLHCPICIRQIAEFETALDEFTALGVEVLALSADNRDAAQQTAEKAGVSRLRIGYGLALKAARDDWGLYLSSAREGSREPALFHEPGHFHVAPDGTLFAGWIQTSPFGRPALKDFKQAITFRQEKNYPPRGTYQGTVPGDG